MRRHLQIMSLKKSDRQGDIGTPPYRGGTYVALVLCGSRVCKRCGQLVYHFGTQAID